MSALRSGPQLLRLCLYQQARGSLLPGSNQLSESLPQLQATAMPLTWRSSVLAQELLQLRRYAGSLGPTKYTREPAKTSKSMGESALYIVSTRCAGKACLDCRHPRSNPTSSVRLTLTPRYALQRHPHLQGAFAVSMVGFTYAMVPLYRAFCAATGYGGAVKTDTIEGKLRARREEPNAEVEAAAAAREVRVWLDSHVADDMPWRFKPKQVRHATGMMQRRPAQQPPHEALRHARPPPSSLLQGHPVLLRLQQPASSPAAPSAAALRSRHCCFTSALQKCLLAWPHHPWACRPA